VLVKNKDLNEQAHLNDDPITASAERIQEGTESDASTGVRQEDYDILKERLSQKETEATEYLDKLKRTQAEMENFRKRMLKEQEQIIQYAAQTVIRELLPVIDNLERALEASKGDTDGGKLLEGVELIYSQIKDLLARECVEVIDPLGNMFDPQKHEAVMQVDSDEYEENVVAEVFQKGYELKGRLLRPAMVKVAK